MDSPIVLTPSPIIIERVLKSLINLLIEVCPALLPCIRKNLEKILTNKEGIGILKKFISDDNIRVIIVGREIEIEGGRRGLKDEDEEDILFISTEIDKRCIGCSSLGFVKRPNINLVEIAEDETHQAIGSKLQILNVGWAAELEEVRVEDQETGSRAIGISHFDLLKNYLQFIADPVLAAQQSTSTVAETEEESPIEVKTNVRNITAARKKLTELIVSVQLAQQNIEVPLVQFMVDPLIRDFIGKSKSIGKKFNPEEFLTEYGNPNNLNQLQAGASKWIKDTQRIVKIDRDPTTGTAAEEINFWVGLDRALVHIEQQLQAPDIEATLSVLRLAKRFIAAVASEAETELKNRLEEVSNINILMRDFPLNDLLAANTIDQLTTAVRTIFNHMKKFKTVIHYPFKRAYNLIEALSRDLNVQLKKILGGYRLFHISFEEFDHVFGNFRELSRVWDDEVRRFKDLIRDQIKRRGIIYGLPPKLMCEHTILNDRVEDIKKCRKQHQKLLEIVRNVMPTQRRTDGGAIREIASAFNVFQTIDPLDVTSNGQSFWDSAKKTYSDKIDRVESQITNKLRDRLGAAKTGTEMFRVFSQFNPLFFRPRIRSAIQEYQASLIQQIKDDFKSLQLKYNEHYEMSQASVVSNFMDIAKICGRIIWSKQLERKLQENVKRIEDVLGRGWEQHTEGQALKQSSDEFLKKLSSQGIFDNWLREVKDTQSLDISSRIFSIVRHGGKGYELIVHYDPEIMFLFKEVRCLTGMGIRVPYSVKASAEDAKFIYPYLMTLQESIRTYTFICNKLDSPKYKIIAPLLARYRRDVQQTLLEDITLRWDHEKLNAFTINLCNKVYMFESKLEDADAQVARIAELLEQMKIVEFSNNGQGFKKALNSIQSIISELSLGNYGNLKAYVRELDSQMESILAVRLEVLIKTWITEFEEFSKTNNIIITEGTFHEFALQNQRLFLVPPLEAARQHWTTEFHKAISSICLLPRLSVNIADTGTIRKDLATGRLRMKSDKTFRYLIMNISKTILQDAYETIDNLMKELSEYVDEWLKYQYLWDIEIPAVVAKVGDDIEAWQQLLSEIRISKSTFDTSEDHKTFGPIDLNYSSAQSKVMIKFETCHREILYVFGTKIFEQVSLFFQKIRQAKEELEAQADPQRLSFLSQQGIDASKTETTTKLTVFVLRLQEARSQEAQWSSRIEHYTQSEKLLERQRFPFPTNWIWMDGVIGEWEAFQQLLRHQSSLLERHRHQLQALVIDHDKRMQESLVQIYSDWSRTKPLHGDTQPHFALQSISRTENKLSQIRADYDKIKNAKRALDIESATAAGDTTILGPEALEEEVQALRGVWTKLEDLYTSVDALKETPWSAVIPRKVRVSLTDLLTTIKKIPAKFRQYEAFEHLQTSLNDYLKLNILLSDLKSDALKERHWKKILETLRLRSNIGLSELTLGHLWVANLTKYETQIRDIMSQAQGELALEEFLHMLRSTWTECELDLVVYKSRCKLIRGWDELFSLLDEHLSSLQSMKISPYYKIFEEEANSWDDKLNRLRVLLDSWMVVQRRWVYLEGVFTGSADIQALLPNEYTRFRAIDNDFLAIMKKTAARPKILDVASTEGLQRSLDRLSDLLSKIQKALGDYLERQRFEFPRFYFVGDEDLLEMIGNSKDVKIVQRHLNKMFAGIMNLIVEDENPDKIIAMASREGESVEFKQAILISNYTSLNAWLRACEKGMFETMAALLSKAVSAFQAIKAVESKTDEFFGWIKSYPAQIVMLSLQIDWTMKTETALKDGGKDLLKACMTHCDKFLELLADQVLVEMDKIQRLKIVQLITELVHQRDVCRNLYHAKVNSERDFEWLRYMRFYWEVKQSEPTDRLFIRMANAQFSYGFEYLGISEKLVQTPLTDECYLTLTQALHLRLGGNPFGPAGTGKTETVKALGAQLGRFVLVFCCDEAFDFQAMGRIFVGLCQVGAWGCFDEFNRLEERILSACSEQILTIQTGLKSNKSEIELLNKSVRLNSAMGIFVTMNPGYAGRSNLPDNLKQLFREIAMIHPDSVQITQVLLYSQGFRSAEQLSGKVVALFELCLQQLSNQSHYDFGLRSLKNVLSSAGNLKRESLTKKTTHNEPDAVDALEKHILLRSICNTIIPKLVASDVPLLRSLLQGVFPGTDIIEVEELALEVEIKRLCQLRHLEVLPAWLNKVLQLYQIQRLNHGVMLVGPVGTGKSSAWRVLLDAMEQVDGVKGFSYILDAKTVPKEHLYGRLDPTTLEWTDGMFTALLRKILNNTHSAANRRHWIVFDGDVDPEWAENLNSVLDDNKLLTLPNGERLQIPSNVRLLFEVDDLKSATLATVSRCGMVWFSEEVLPGEAISLHFLNAIRYGDIEEQFLQSQVAGGVPAASGGSVSRAMSRHHVSFEEGLMIGVSKQFDDHPELRIIQAKNMGSFTEEVDVTMAPPPSAGFLGGLQFTLASTEAEMKVRRAAVDVLLPYFDNDGFLSKCINLAATAKHVMDFTVIRVLESTFSLVRKFISQIVEYNDLRSDFPMTDIHMEKVLTKGLLFSICWGCGGAMALADRILFCQKLVEFATKISLPLGLDAENTILDYEVRIDDGEWHHWRERVASVEIEAHQVQDASMVIETIDTIRHRSVLAAWLEEKKPFILCGPPGSGKTMTLTSTLKGVSDFEIAFLNFSSGTTPELLLKTFDHYCEYVKTTAGMVLRPIQPGKWLIVFADEINLPAPDKYGTQRVIMLMRLMQEYSGFWKITDPIVGQWSWIRMERIQFAGACNPPTDAGRHHMSNRFLRHAPIMFVDFPGSESLRQVYGTMNRGLLKGIPSLRHYWENLTNAMVEFYVLSQKRFTVDQQPHYIYSPRELTRWKVALHEALNQRDQMQLEEFVRLFIHEGLRIFQDRLVETSEKDWTDETINNIALKNFSGIDTRSLRRPMLYCCYLSQNYAEVQREELRGLIQGKLRIFNEEELNVQLVLFDQVLDHIARIDRVLRQPLGHLLLVGASGAGKTVLSKFVSWLNGLSVFQIKAGRNYDTLAFEADLRIVMKRAGLKDERITFIFDESNALGPAFLERMNALLASGEVPGLFEGDEFIQLMTEAKQAYGSDLRLDEQELFSRFTKQVQRNLHIVFTMNPANADFANRQSTSPALFNRCVIDWFGDWQHEALIQVAREFTQPLELSPHGFNQSVNDGEMRRDRLANVIVSIHEAVADLNKCLLRSGKKYNYDSPRDFLDFIRHFMKLVGEKKGETVENTKHLNVGLAKLKETEQQVAELSDSLSIKDLELKEKNKQAEEKMQLMVEQQAVAEDRKKAAESLAADLDIKAEVIENRKIEVEAELKEVEPLLREAESAVSNIPKKFLDELRAMANPPSLVKFALEPVVVMLNNMGFNPISWEDCRKVLKSGDFINRVITFDSMSTSPTTVQRIRQKSIDNELWDIDKITRASKAAGPLATWVESSISFQVIVQKVEPLKKEITELEQEQSINQKALESTQSQISSLETRLQAYKTEYAQLISDVQMIKKEMESVQYKVKRSTQLLKNLVSEKERWSNASSSSKMQLLTVIGDSLLAGAFATYVGFFEYSDRAKLVNIWKDLLEEYEIKYLQEISLVEYLSKPSERYNWISHSLPSDDLSIENAIILKRFIRYPLIIDPSGQASNFLSNQFADRKLVKTSFIDSMFFKNLESCLRFGNPLLVQDVEKVDPILNSVLNQETHKSGGRVLITVGDSEIDFSPMFTMFLITRDPTAEFTPDLSSRVTFVNFTLTPSSLQNQCLSLALKSERPDVDKKRSDILKLQGEFMIRIRELEDALLHALSNVKGNILDDDNVLTTLETLKSQAEDVAQEAARADQVMSEVLKTSVEYLPLAASAARLYFTLQSMQCLRFFYHYDLLFFESAFHDVLTDTVSLSKFTDYAARQKVLFDLLFRKIYQKCAIGLMHDDRLVLALQLARIRFESEYNIPLGGNELTVLLQGQEVVTVNESASRNQAMPATFDSLHSTELFDAAQIRAIQALTSLKAFENLPQHINATKTKWKELLQTAKPEALIPSDCYQTTTSEDPLSEDLKDEQSSSIRKKHEVLKAIREALIIKALRPDRISVSLTKIVEVLCDNDFLSVPEVSQEDLHRIVTKELKSVIPVVLIASPGFDPSSKVAWAAKRQNQSLSSIAMGSEEGYGVADKAIATAARQGSWVLLKNVHLSSSWLHQLEKKLFRMHLHDNFRIFLTMEVSEKVPRNLFRVSFVFLFEPPAGIRASMQRTYHQFLPSSRADRNPVVARNRLHYILAYLHAIILERKRYIPFGWSKHYEFSDADQHCALDVIDQWLDCAAGTFVHTTVKNETLPETLDPSKIPFEALRTLLKKSIYGGRLDNEVDKRALGSFIDNLFRPEAFESDFCLSEGYKASDGAQSYEIPAYAAPDLLRSKDQYSEFIDSSKATDEPLWLGLSPKADRLISARNGIDAISRWFTLNSKSAEELHDMLPRASQFKSRPSSRSRSQMIVDRSAQSSGWLADMKPLIINMIELLPSELILLERSEEAINDPLFRCFDREVSTASRLLEKVRSDLIQLKEVCDGETKFTNYSRQLARNISRGLPHEDWLKQYKIPPGTLLREWLNDFCLRISQLGMIGTEFGGGSVNIKNQQSLKYSDSVQSILGQNSPPPSQRVVWFGGLIFPKAFITATRQSVAQNLEKSLDDLYLVLTIGGKLTPNNGFILGGLVLENASWNGETLTLADTLFEVLPPVLLEWKTEKQNNQDRVEIPIFLTKQRTEFIGMVDLPIPSKKMKSIWYQRGTALILWNQV